MTESALSTNELLQIVNPVQEGIREIITDESETKICRGCGEPDTKETCLCEPTKKIRFIASGIFIIQEFETDSNFKIFASAFEKRAKILAVYLYKSLS